jgi:hypothetical protein
MIRSFLVAIAIFGVLATACSQQEAEPKKVETQVTEEAPTDATASSTSSTEDSKKLLEEAIEQAKQGKQVSNPAAYQTITAEEVHKVLSNPIFREGFKEEPVSEVYEINNNGLIIQYKKSGDSTVIDQLKVEAPLQP